MAKDRRNKTAGSGKTVRTTPSSSKKRKKGKGRRIVTIAALVFLLLLAILIFVVARAVLAGSGQKDTSTSDVNVYNTTPTSLQGKMAYYAVGLLGEEETSATEALMLICHDKNKGTLNILEIPQDTYLGNSDLWSVKKAGLVWGNPAPLDWCEFEGKRLYKAEIAEHEAAGHTISQRTGSASYNLISIFNEQYSLPVDEYFMIPQAAFVKLVNLVGGVDVELEASMKVGTVTYQKGLATLDGDAALQYVKTRDSGTKGDIDRILRQRKVFLALFQRLCSQTQQQLEEESLAPVMKGSTPIRTEMSTAELVELVMTLADIEPASMTAQILPGEVTAYDSTSYYSVYRSDLLTQLNTYFNPYGETITDADLQVTELVAGSGADVHLQVLSELVVEQSGTAATTQDPDTTTTTEKAD